ncbi:MAG: polysaccharide pyruvyl transferase family protein [Flavobacteriales bacterium]
MPTPSQKQKHILLVNAVLTNNGDVAITLALYQRLVKEGFQVKIATHHLDKIKAHYPELPLIADVGSEFILRKLPILKRLFKPLIFSRKQEFKEADAVVAVPGGFMNSYYDFPQLVAFFKRCNAKLKTVGVYANSFGPFSEKDQQLLKDSESNFSVLMARDERSVNELEEIGISTDTYFKGNDAAFLLDQLSSRPTPKTAAISVREWKNDARDMAHYSKLIAAVTRKLVAEGYEVEFLSTCQGIEGYVNDATTAQNIMSEHLSDLKNAVCVNSEYYTLSQLREKLAGYDLVVGTRLHMCLLALKSGTPALNISYEFKGKEAYNYLGLSQYSVDFNGPLEEAANAVTLLISNKEQVREKLLKLMEEQKQLAEAGFEEFKRRLAL